MRRAKRQFGHQMEKRIKIALIGAGMFGGDVHLRAYANFQHSGLSPHLGRIGLDHWGRELSPVEFELTAIAARSKSSAERACDAFENLTGQHPIPYSGAEPWMDVLRDIPD